MIVRQYDLIDRGRAWVRYRTRLALWRCAYILLAGNGALLRVNLMRAGGARQV